MAVAAALDAAAGCDKAALKALYFASASSPYQEKQAATQIAAALDVNQNLRTGDFANTLRAGSAAMLAAIDAVKSEGGQAMVTMSDCRLGAADGKFESDLGDAAAAFVLGGEDLLAELNGSVSVAKDVVDQWRADDDVYVRDWDVRYANTQLYTPLVTKAAKAVLGQLDMTAADITKVVLYGHDEKTRSGLAAKLGFQPEQVVAGMYGEIGNTGNAAAGLMLCSALDTAKAGDKILVVTYGEGCDAMVFTVTDKAETYRPARTVEKLLAHKDEELPYGKYLKWKGMVDCEPQKRPAQERSALPSAARQCSRPSECASIATPLIKWNPIASWISRARFAPLPLTVCPCRWILPTFWWFWNSRAAAS